MRLVVKRVSALAWAALFSSVVAAPTAGAGSLTFQADFTGAATADTADSAKADSTADKGPFKPWSDVLKDTRAIEGFFTVHLKRDASMLIELPVDRLAQDFGLVMHYSQGVGVFNVHDGLPLSGTRLMRWQRVGDKVYLVHRNVRFIADEGSPMQWSLNDNVGHSIVAAFDIKSEHDSTNALLIDVTSFFVSDYAAVSRVLKPSYQNKPVTFDKERSYVDEVMGFPQNVEIDALLTYKANDPPGGTSSSSARVSDVRSVPVGVRYSLFQLPEDPMQPRIADDRVGQFVDAVRDFSRDKAPTQYVRFVNRWRLEKRNPNAAMSEPVEPIVYYIDKSVPLEYRQYVKEGIEAWNAAYETAGFRNAIVAREAPGDPDWHAEDIRYSTVRWTAAHRMGYAIGPSQSDPRTGELLNADILISTAFMSSWVDDWAEIVGPEDMDDRLDYATQLQSQLPPNLAGHVCLAEFGKAQQLAFQYMALSALGVIDGTKPMPEEYIAEAIRDLIMHEVGHTLGLRHNFKASSAIPYDRLNDKGFTAEHGLTLSVMDYGPVNIALDRNRQGDYYNRTVGSYDKWAIEYAYRQFPQSMGTNGGGYGSLIEAAEQELPLLRRIAERGADPMHAYNTDEDTHLGPLSLDPTSNTWDLGSDPLRYAADRAELVARTQPELERRLIADGDSYDRLRAAFNSLVFERYRALVPVTKYVGGVYFSRDHRGDPNGRQPFRPVSADRQREALQLIIDQAFAEDAWEFDAELLNKTPPRRFGDWSGSFFVTPIDLQIHNMIRARQASLLSNLLHGGRLTRMVDNTVRADDSNQFTVADMFGMLTDEIWSELGNGTAPRSVNSFRRNLQRAYIDRFVQTLLSRDQSGASRVPDDARSLARFYLVELSGRIDRALNAGPSADVETRAHLMESHARIERALEASVAAPLN